MDKFFALYPLFSKKFCFTLLKQLCNIACQIVMQPRNSYYIFSLGFPCNFFKSSKSKRNASSFLFLLPMTIPTYALTPPILMEVFIFLEPIGIVGTNVLCDFEILAFTEMPTIFFGEDIYLYDLWQTSQTR